MLALAQPVEGKIVYTPAHEKFTWYPGLILDLAHDGTRDFRLALGSRAETGFRSGYAFVSGLGSGNGAIATAKQNHSPAVALPAGSRIGSGGLFDEGPFLVEEIYNYGKGFHSTVWNGQWGNGGKGLSNRYLGLKFIIKGKVHFGWARVTVKTDANNFTAILTGYAYETVPNKAIIAGKTHGPDVIAEHGTLGELAAGSK